MLFFQCFLLSKNEKKRHGSRVAGVCKCPPYVDMGRAPTKPKDQGAFLDGSRWETQTSKIGDGGLDWIIRYQKDIYIYVYVNIYIYIYI